MGWQDAPIVKPAQGKQPWDDAPIVRRADQAAPDPQQLTLATAAFPEGSKDYQEFQAPAPNYGIVPNSGTVTVTPRDQKLVAGAGDALSLPTRLVGVLGRMFGYKGATGGKEGLEALADPETGLARPARQVLGGVISDAWQGGDNGRGAADYAKLTASIPPYLLASMVEDPAVLLGGAAKMAPRVIGKAAQAAFAPVRTASRGAANVAEAAANKVQNTIVRPRAMDEAAGFKIENLEKHGVTGSLEEVIGKSQSKIESAAANLKSLIQQGKDNGARVDLNRAVADVEKEIMGGKAKEFANLKESPAALKDIRERIELLAESAPGGQADLVDAQYIKQALGDMGAFEHVAGKQGVQISKEDRTLSQIASRVYLKLKDQIETAAPEGVKEQNRIMSDLIPVNRAALYRKLVADRNNVVSMSDMLGALATIGGGPNGLALWAASKASTKGTTAKILYSAAKKLRSAGAPAEVAHYSQALQNLGVTAAEIEAVMGIADAPNVVPFRRVASDKNIPTPLRSPPSGTNIPPYLRGGQ